jgi:hypothetical protein
VGDDLATTAVGQLESLLHISKPAAAQAIIEEVIAAASAIDARAKELHREIDAAIDHDLGAVAALTKELRATYVARDRVRGAMQELRATRPQLFDLIEARQAEPR